MDEQQFLNFYQSIKFQESSDCFSAATTKRLTLLLNFYGSNYFKENNHVTEFLLNEDFKDYSEIVDDRSNGKVNNYADQVLAHLSNYQNDDKINWKSNLDEFDIEEHIKNLPCSGNINCKYSNEVIIEEINKLKQAFSSTSEDIFCEKITKSKSPPKINMPEKNTFEFDTFQSKKPRQDVTSNFDNRSSTVNPKHSKNNEEDKPQFNYFRTARDELQIQNAKKFSKGNTHGHEGANDKNYAYGAVKKSLGTRKGGGVFGKFQPPIRSKNENDDGLTKMEVDEVVDERLKNIDPAMIELIKSEIMDCGSKITWNDIAGLDLAKSTIQEIVVWPMLRPDIFTGLRRPPKGILLFGPPGTGKTLIGKCIASQSNSTFFSISASSLTSKWVGDGEKMVRTLFAVAKVHQPSVVFVDEIDSLLSQRSDSEHESSRRIKTEFLVQLDGAGTGDEDRILIIGATNRPQELDEAARRRLVKRLYIPLPDENARKEIIKNLISTEKHCLNDVEIHEIAKLTKGYSGADVKNLCQEASLGPIRSITPSLIQTINFNDVRPVNSNDFQSALTRIKSSVSEKDLDIYLAWDKLYGCGSVTTS